MHKKRPRTLVTFLALGALAAQAQAVGFGPGPTGAVLGQTLDQSVAVRLDAGERLGPECVSADVMVGDQRLPASAIRTRLEGEGSALSVRVQTTSVIDEPVVTLAVSVGCPTRLSRRFVLFADPAPASAPSAPIAMPVDELQPPAPDRKAPAAVPPAEAHAAAPAPTPAAAVTPGAAVTPVERRAPRTVAKRPRKTEPAVAAPAARPRLKLDAVDPPPAPLAADVIQAAASAAAAEAVALATSQAAARVSALERSLEKLRVDSAADREALRVLRQRLADEGQASSTWLPVLGGLVAALAVLALWLGLQLRRLQAERRQTWWNAAGSPEAAAATASGTGAVPTELRTDAAPLAPLTAAAIGPATAAGYPITRPGTLGPVFTPDPSDPITEPPLMAIERTQALPVGWREEPEPQRDVSIEELIDLEQQAEFFIVLGQEEAAIDLLVDHLRSTGGGSPLPYLKLLEIYRRRGDREAYDRTRARFNHRFNAYAPDWDTDTQDGRSLEDYPSIVARLQMAWPSPIDAMAELESLLFRKTRGELFDMPAYRDVLFLYSLARDLLDREPAGAANVDVLLPINEGGDFTQPMSLDDLARPGDSDLMPLDNPPTVPVDLDVTQPVMPDSLFGENATDPGTGGGRRRR